MTSVLVRTFRSGNSQAVRLPKSIAFDDGVELRVERQGDVVTLQPNYGPRPNARLIARLRALPNPPDGVQERDPFDDPERPGL